MSVSEKNNRAIMDALKNLKLAKAQQGQKAVEETTNVNEEVISSVNNKVQKEDNMRNFVKIDSKSMKEEALKNASKLEKKTVKVTENIGKSVDLLFRQNERQQAIAKEEAEKQVTIQYREMSKQNKKLIKEAINPTAVEDKRVQRALKKAVEETAQMVAVKALEEKGFVISKEEIMQKKNEVMNMFITASIIDGGWNSLVEQFNAGNLPVIAEVAKGRSKQKDQIVKSLLFTDLLRSHISDFAAIFIKIAKSTSPVKNVQATMEAIFNSAFNLKQRSGRFTQVKVFSQHMLAQLVQEGYEPQLVINVCKEASDGKKQGDDSIGLPIVSGTISNDWGIHVDAQEREDAFINSISKNGYSVPSSISYYLTIVLDKEDKTEEGVEPAALSEIVDLARASNYASQQGSAKPDQLEFVSGYILRANVKGIGRRTNYSGSFVDEQSGRENVFVFNQNLVVSPVQDHEAEFVDAVIQHAVSTLDVEHIDTEGTMRIENAAVEMLLSEDNDGGSLIYLNDFDAAKLNMTDKNGLISDIAKFSGVGYGKDGRISHIFKGLGMIITYEDLLKIVPNASKDVSMVIANTNSYKHISKTHVEGDVVTTDLYIMNVGQIIKDDTSYSDKSMPHYKVMSRVIRHNAAVFMADGKIRIKGSHALGTSNVFYHGGKDKNTFAFDTKEEAMNYALELGVKQEDVEALTVQLDSGKWSTMYVITNSKELLELAAISGGYVIITREPAYGTGVKVPVIKSKELLKTGHAPITQPSLGLSKFIEQMDNDGDSMKALCDAKKGTFNVGYIFESNKVQIDKARIESGLAKFEGASEAETEKLLTELLSTHWIKFCENNNLNVFTGAIQKQTDKNAVVEERDVIEDSSNSSNNVDYSQIAKFIGSGAFIGIFTGIIYRLNEGLRDEVLHKLVEEPVKAMKHGTNLASFLLILQQINEIQDTFKTTFESKTTKYGKTVACSYKDVVFRYKSQATLSFPFIKSLYSLGNTRTMIEKAIELGKKDAVSMINTLSENLGFTIDKNIAAMENHVTMDRIVLKQYGMDDDGRPLATKEERIYVFVSRFVKMAEKAIKTNDPKIWSRLFGMMMLTKLNTSCVMAYATDATDPIDPVFKDLDKHTIMLQKPFFNELLVKKAENSWRHMYHTIDFCRKLTDILIDGRNVSIFEGGSDISFLTFDERKAIVSEYIEYFNKKNQISEMATFSVAQDEKNARIAVENINKLAGFVPPIVLSKAVLKVNKGITTKKLLGGMVFVSKEVSSEE